jgi:tetratricopeptide (TPR) repeat protein
MIRIHKIRSLLLITTLLAVLCAGCGKEFKRSRNLAAGNRDFQAEQYDMAEIEYLNVLKVAPADAIAVSRLGLIYFAEGKLQRAFAFLQRAADLDSENTTVRLRLGQTCLVLRKFEETREQAVFVLNKAPTNDEALLLLAESAANPGAVLETVQLVEECRQKGGRDMPGFHLALATLHMRQKALDEAEAEAQKALMLDPKSGAAYGILGALSLLRNQPRTAEAQLETAAELSPLRSGRHLALANFKLLSGSIDSAKRLALDLTQKVPDYVPPYSVLAAIAAAEQKYDDCAGLIRKVLVRDPGNIEALMINGRMLLAQGKLTNAIAQFDQINSLYGKVPQAELELGRAYILNGDLNKAVANLNQAITADPSLTDAVLLLADINTRKGNPSSAIASLKKLIAEKPGIAQAHFLLAGAYVIHGKLSEATNTLHQLIATFPPDAKVPYLLGMVLVQQGNNSEARRAFERARELSPDYIPALEQLVNLDLFEKQYRAARQRVSEQMARDSSSADPWLLIAKIELAQEDNEQAEAALLKANQLNPALRMPYDLLARLYVANHKQEQALLQLNELVARRTNDLVALMQIGVLHSELKDYVRARDTYERVLAINPRFVPALNNLANLSFERFGQLDKACEYARRARDLSPGDPFAADTLGWLLYQKHDYSYALTLLQESAAKLPDEPEVHFHLAMTYYMLDQPELALLVLQRVLDSSKDFHQKDEALRCLALLNLNVATADAATVQKLEAQLLQDSDPVALDRLACIHERDGSSDKAINAWERLLASNPKNARAVEHLARLYDTYQHNCQKALEIAKDAHSLDPDDPHIAYTLGRLAFKNGDHRWAFSLLQESARKLSAEPQVLFDFAWSSFSVGRFAEAEAAMKEVSRTNEASSKAQEARRFVTMLGAISVPDKPSLAVDDAQKILAAEPKYSPALFVVAMAREQAGHYAEAAQCYEQILTQFPLCVPAARNLALLYANRLADDSRALPLATKAHEALPQDFALSRALGLLAYRRGDYATCAQLLKSCAAKRNDDGELLYYLGMSQYRLKQSTETRTSLQGALALNLAPMLAHDARRVLAELQ